MKFPIHPGRFYADDTPTGAYTEPVDPQPEVTPPPVITEPTATAATLTLTPEELDARIAAGVLSAVRTLQSEGGGAAPTPTEPDPASYNPAHESFSLVKESTKMNTEALTMYADLPDEYKAWIEAQLEQVPPDQIATFRKNGLHKTLARSAMAQAIDDGKYVPKRFVQSAAPVREPVGGGTPTLNTQDPAKNAFNAEIDELEGILGRGLSAEQRAKLKLTPEERAAAYGR